MTTFTDHGRTYKVFPVRCFGNDYEVVVKKHHYAQNNTIALVVENISTTADGSFTYLEPFGTLTVNVPCSIADGDKAFVKNYSENEEWAEQLALAIGGVKTGVYEQTGFVSVPLYDFSNINIVES